MNFKIIFYTIGRMLKFMGVALILPMFIAFVYHENVLPYIFTILIFEGLGFAFGFKKPKDSKLYAKEASISIGLSWVIISLIGATLFVFSKTIPSYTDAVFETVSGLTTTGSTILAEIESLPKGILFYRSYNVFLGGIGILVFLVSLTTNENSNAISLYRAEAAGPNVQKMTSKLKNTALITFFIYVGLALLQFIALLITGISWFDAITVTFSTAGTGGFVPTNQSILSYNNLATEIVTTIFMLIFSVNFNVYFMMFIGKFFGAIKNEELWTFISIYIISTLLVALNISSTVGGFKTALRYSSFEISSTMSSTGFANSNYNEWPIFSQTLIMVLMLFGGCAGSTAGGLKIIRLITLTKSSKQRINQTINPRKMMNVKIDGKIQDETYLNSIYFYFYVYTFLIILGTILVSFDPAFVGAKGVGEALSCIITTFNNSGPGIGIIGPLDNFSMLSKFTKWVCSIAMLIGRLEIFPILILFMPSTWKRNRNKQKQQALQNAQNN